MFLFSAGFPPFDDVSEVDLTTHMLQHVLIIISGVMIAYPLYGRDLLKRDRGGPLPTVAFAASAAAVVLWHYPTFWDAAVLDPVVHVVEHISFLGVGLLVGSWVLLLKDSGRLAAVIAAFFTHMAYAVVLVDPVGFQVYPLYSVADQAILGWVLILTGPSLLVGAAYVVARNPDWLGGYYGKGQEGRRPFQVGFTFPRWTAPLCTALLLLGTVGYGGYVAYGLSSQASQAGVVVTIQETPYSWQYSPQFIKVVLGVNNTVLWRSESISFDTVTVSGIFDSGAIPPGGAFSHTFTQPGTYSYYCAYHPWMKGTVEVLP
jgi:plastocyanin